MIFPSLLAFVTPLKMWPSQLHGYVYTKAEPPDRQNVRSVNKKEDFNVLGLKYCKSKKYC